MIELKVNFRGKIKTFGFLDEDECWAQKQKKYYEHDGYPCELIYKNTPKTISLERLFNILDDIINDGYEHASDILPELKKRI